MSDRDALQDLWIDGRVYRVPAAVAGHVRFLHDLNARLADRGVRLAQENAVLRHGRADAA